MKLEDGVDDTVVAPPQRSGFSGIADLIKSQNPNYDKEVKELEQRMLAALASIPGTQQSAEDQPMEQVAEDGLVKKGRKARDAADGREMGSQVSATLEKEAHLANIEAKHIRTMGSAGLPESQQDLPHQRKKKQPPLHQQFDIDEDGKLKLVSSSQSSSSNNEIANDDMKKMITTYAGKGVDMDKLMSVISGGEGRGGASSGGGGGGRRRKKLQASGDDEEEDKDRFDLFINKQGGFGLSGATSLYEDDPLSYNCNNVVASVIREIKINAETNFWMTELCGTPSATVVPQLYSKIPAKPPNL